MIQVIKLHLGLIKYLLQELSKRKTLKEKINIFKPIPKAYARELLRIYKTLFLVFDKDYQKQKAQYKKMQNIKVDLQRCIKILKYVDEKMDGAGVNRQRRRQFWRDFYKDGAMRKEVFDQLLNEIERIK